MADKSAIEWTDATWSPVTGCTKVSAGCKHCYAEREVETRWSKNPKSEWFEGSFNDVRCRVNPKNANRGYRHEMSDEDHLALLDALRGGVKGMVVLSGYASELYDRALPGWEKRTTTARISAGRGTSLRQEVLWLNPACQHALHGRHGLFAATL